MAFVRQANGYELSIRWAVQRQLPGALSHPRLSDLGRTSLASGGITVGGLPTLQAEGDGNNDILDIIDDIHFEGMHYRTDIGRRQEVRR